MDDANLYNKQQTYLNTCSDADDSTSFPSFPWFPENNRRRKSRLGTHRNQIRRLYQETTPNEGDHSSSNKENVYDRFSSNTVSANHPPVETLIGQLEPLISNDCKLYDQTSPLSLITQVFNDEVSPFVTSFEKSKTAASSFPPHLTEDEIHDILREMNSSNKVCHHHFPLSPRSNGTRTSTGTLEKSFDSSTSSMIANQFQTVETKLNNSFSGELPNDVSSIPAVEDLSFASCDHTNNRGPVAKYVNSDYMNSIDHHGSSIRRSNIAKNTELLDNLKSLPVTENDSLYCMNSASTVPDLDSKNSAKLSDYFSHEPMTDNCSFDCTVSPTSILLQSRNQVSDPLQPARVPINLFSMQDQDNAIGFQNTNEKNSKYPMDLSSRLDQENDLNFQYPNINPELPIDLSSMQDQNNYIQSQNSNEINPELPPDKSSIQDQENTANSQNPVESASYQVPEEITNNIEVDGALSLTKHRTITPPISNVAEIPSTVKLQTAPIPVSSVEKISGSSVACDSNLEQKNIPLVGKSEIPLPNTAVVVPLFEAPKPSVQFVESAVREFVVPRNSSKIPAVITVKGKSYKVLNKLGSGGSSVVYQVSDPETNELLALKKVDLPEEDDEITDGYLNEVQMLENLQNCDVIIRIFDHQLINKNGKKTLHVVMEKGDTDLSNLIKSVNESKKLSIPMIIYYWTEMLAAVNEVHRRGIIHSDLKPANFVLVRGRLKLIDFGIASSIQGDVTSVYKDFFCGTLNYMSPEATSCVECPSGGAGYKITFKTDVWSLGCILYNLVYGRLPFHHIRKRFEKIHAIVSPTINVEFPEKKDVPPILISLLKSCLEKDYKKRPTVQELLDRTMRIFQCSSVD